MRELLHPANAPTLEHAKEQAAIASLNGCSWSFQSAGQVLSKDQLLSASPVAVCTTNTSVTLEVEVVTADVYNEVSAAFTTGEHTTTESHNKAVETHLADHHPAWLAKAMLGMMLTGRTSCVLTVAHRSSSARAHAMLRMNSDFCAELRRDLIAAIRLHQGCQRVSPARVNAAPSSGGVTRRPNRERYADTNCPGLIKLEVRAAQSGAGGAVVVASVAPCDGSHPYAGVDKALEPAGEELVAWATQKELDGVQLAALVKRLHRLEGKPVDTKRLAYLLCKEVTKFSDDAGAPKDDQAAYVMTLAEAGFTLSWWTLGNEALARAEGRQSKRTKRSAGASMTAAHEPSPASRGPSGINLTSRSSLVVATVGDRCWVLPPGWMATGRRTERVSGACLPDLCAFSGVRAGWWWGRGQATADASGLKPKSVLTTAGLKPKSVLTTGQLVTSLETESVLMTWFNPSPPTLRRMPRSLAADKRPALERVGSPVKRESRA